MVESEQELVELQGKMLLEDSLLDSEPQMTLQELQSNGSTPPGQRMKPMSEQLELEEEEQDEEEEELDEELEWRRPQGHGGFTEGLRRQLGGLTSGTVVEDELDEEEDLRRWHCRGLCTTGGTELLLVLEDGMTAGLRWGFPQQSGFFIKLTCWELKMFPRPASSILASAMAGTLNWGAEAAG